MLRNLLTTTTISDESYQTSLSDANPVYKQHNGHKLQEDAFS
jgi:hypothetical protein